MLLDVSFIPLSRAAVQTRSPLRAYVRVISRQLAPLSRPLQAVVAASALIEGKLGKDLKQFLKKQIVKRELTDELAVADAKLGGLIKEKLDIPVSSASCYSVNALSVCLPLRCHPLLRSFHSCAPPFPFSFIAVRG